jgi:hypothetical protein
VVSHREVMKQPTGWKIGTKEATDDRLGDLLTALGENEERDYDLQRGLGIQSGRMRYRPRSHGMTRRLSASTMCLEKMGTTY